MKKLWVLLCFIALTACNEQSSTTTSTAQAPQSVDYSLISEFNLVNSGYREYDGKPAAWVMFTKPIAKHIDVNLHVSLHNKAGVMSGAWQVDND